MARDKHFVAVAAILGDVGQDPGGGCGRVLQIAGVLDLGREAVAHGGDRDRGGFQVDEVPAPVLQAAAVEPDHRGEPFTVSGIAQIEPALRAPVIVRAGQRLLAIVGDVRERDRPGWRRLRESNTERQNGQQSEQHHSCTHDGITIAQSGCGIQSIAEPAEGAERSTLLTAFSADEAVRAPSLAYLFARNARPSRIPAN
jgi:hypothetical protein